MRPSLFAIFSLIILVQLSTCQVDSNALSEKIEQLTEWSLKKPVIRLNFEKFKHFVKSAPRNYSIVVMLTALAPHRGCQICRPANDEFQIVAQSWRYSPQFSNKLFFAMVDFDDAPDIFKMLNTASAPQFIMFGRKQGKPKTADHFDISRVGFSAEQIAKWINDRTDINIRIFRPPNYSGLLLVVLLVSMIASLLYVKRNNLEFLYNKTTWSMIVISAILIFISGQMWNQIRGPPMVYRNPKTGQVPWSLVEQAWWFSFSA
ncbi:tumor suppressor candidate 3 [Brachionus plicatilis]|uniref:Tumor suppressor candidate 3 n=1 Tax=Brachionus plicatilis TaxID=10195 RepID=A0A3M7RPY2_BRAPC|nr:tumor suppressor candidate 3 [Brachionus plicatilis]